MRKVHINNQIWHYSIGKQNVIIESPEEIQWVVAFDKLLNMKWSDIERGQWKRYFTIKPSNIKTYIESNLI
jgi:hypothetical protein